jgi:hypothetical protein
MTATQTIKLVEVLKKYLKNAEDANTVVTEIEGIIEGKFTATTTTLAIKADLAATKADIKEAKVDTIKWMISMFVIQTAIILGFLYFMLKR